MILRTFYNTYNEKTLNSLFIFILKYHISQHVVISNNIDVLRQLQYLVSLKFHTPVIYYRIMDHLYLVLYIEGVQENSNHT